MCWTRTCASATRARRTRTTWIPSRTRHGFARRWTPCSPPPIPSAAPSSGSNEPVTGRRRLVRVPATSANLGPGYDVLAAALDIHLELEVSESDDFHVDPGGDGLPADRSNLCVRAFERLH